ncbi:substrate-binding domain-containing protein, partial [Mycobacterium tuberculosis]|nr:substrate-binding domain-containing protein [Mycobacterium tuberculosis]
IQDLYVAGNNPQLGVNSANYMVKKLGGKGNIVVLRGIPTVIDTQRFDAFMDIVKKTDIKVLDSKFANWNRDDGFKVM